MFERYTDRGRRTVVLAQEEARLLNSPYIGSEHLLLGLSVEAEGVAAKALTRFGVTSERTRAYIKERSGTDGQAPAGHLPFTPNVKSVFDRTTREALQLGHNYVGTEHLLLGLIASDARANGVQILVGDYKLSLVDVRREVINLLSSYLAPPSPPKLADDMVSVPLGLRREFIGWLGRIQTFMGPLDSEHPAVMLQSILED